MKGGLSAMTFSKQLLRTAYQNISISLSYMRKTEDTKVNQLRVFHS